MTLFSWFLKNKIVNDPCMEKDSDKSQNVDLLLNSLASVNKAAIEFHQIESTSHKNTKQLNVNMWPTASVRPPIVVKDLTTAIKPKYSAITNKSKGSLPKIKPVTFIKDSL